MLTDGISGGNFSYVLSSQVLISAAGRGMGHCCALPVPCTLLTAHLGMKVTPEVFEMRCEKTNIQEVKNF